MNLHMCVCMYVSAIGDALSSGVQTVSVFSYKENMTWIMSVQATKLERTSILARDVEMVCVPGSDQDSGSETTGMPRIKLEA